MLAVGLRIGDEYEKTELHCIHTMAATNMCEYDQTAPILLHLSIFDYVGLPPTGLQTRDTHLTVASFTLSVGLLVSLLPGIYVIYNWDQDN